MRKTAPKRAVFFAQYSGFREVRENRENRENRGFFTASVTTYQPRSAVAEVV